MARLSKTDIERTQAALESLYNTMSRLIERPPPNLDGMANRVGLGADDLRKSLDKMGLNCSCRPTPYARYGKKYLCTCAKAGSRRLSGVDLSGLSGSGCRDAQGRFVPVPQCTGRLPPGVKITIVPKAKPKAKRKKNERKIGLHWKAGRR